MKPEYVEGQEAQRRFEQVVRAALNTPPLKKAKQVTQADSKRLQDSLKNQ